jgi:hypothetical protein
MEVRLQTLFASDAETKMAISQDGREIAHNPAKGIIHIGVILSLQIQLLNLKLTTMLADYVAERLADGHRLRATQPCNCPNLG